MAAPFKGTDMRKLDGREFYKGTGYDNLTGPEAEKVEQLKKAQRAMMDGIKLRGNLFEPVLQAEFPGCPTPIPINLYGLPDRRLDYCMVVIKPNYGFPLHYHAAFDEVYLVIQGKGEVFSQGEWHPAKQFDIFHMPATMPHTLRNPETNTEDLCVFIVNSPNIPWELRMKDFALPIKEIQDDLIHWG